MDVLAFNVACRFSNAVGTPSIRFAHHALVGAALVDAGLIEAGALRDVSKLRYQAVFLMGAGGSGKGFVGERWMKYMPGAPSEGAPREQREEMFKRQLSEAERGLSNLNFEKAVAKLKSRGFKIELAEGGSAAKTPFRLYTYDHQGKEHLIDPSEYATTLPPDIAKEVRGLEEIIFGTPVHELPSYWRQVNPDIYKEELSGYRAKDPGYVHEMSSEMSKAYFEAILETGDPLFVDGTGANPKKMAEQINAAKAAGYKTSVILVIVPLTVNQIRNALRARNVNPEEVARQWKAIVSSYATIRGVADKARVIVNRNDSKDIADFKANSERIDDFIRRKTHFNSLYDFIASEAPAELTEWGKVIKPAEASERATGT